MYNRNKMYLVFKAFFTSLQLIKTAYAPGLPVPPLNPDLHRPAASEFDWLPWEPQQEAIYTALGGLYPQVFRLKSREHSYSWLIHAFVARLREANRPSPDYPFSWIVFYNRDYAVDVVKDDSDIYGRSYLLTIYDREPEEPDIIRDQETQRPIIKEGPFRVRPLHEYDEIVLRPDWKPAPPWVFAILNRQNNHFEVRHRDFQMGFLPNGWTVKDWLQPDQNMVARPWPESAFIEYDQPFIVDAQPYTDVNSFERQTLIVRIWSAEDPKGIQASYDPTKVIVEGPWLIRPAQTNSRYHIFPTWEPRWPWWLEYWRSERHETPQFFNDFVMMRRPPDENSRRRPGEAIEDGRRVHARRYINTCMRPDTLYYIQPSQSVNEFFNVEGFVQTQSADASEDYALPESIEVRSALQNRVIAQTVHTDHLDFRFNSPPRPSDRGVFNLLVCIFSGRSDTKVELYTVG